MSSEARAKIDALSEGKAHTEPEADWDLVQRVIGVDLEDYDCDYDHYITGRLHPVTFIKGDVEIDGHTSSHGIVEGREGYVPPTEYDEEAVVILGDLHVSGNLALDELTPLFVSGNVKTHTIVNTYGTLVAGGSIEAELIYCASADEGGQIHTDACSTKLLIDASGTLDYHCDGDYPFLLANNYSPRQRYTLQRSLESLGFDDFGMTFSSEVRALAEQPERLARLIELVAKYRDARPENVPENAEWSEGYPPGYRLVETDDDGEPHGVDGHWKADGTVRHVKHFEHGVPHGEWITEHNGSLKSRRFVRGELERPEGVPEDAVWKENDWEWEQAPRDDDGEMHGLVRWWRSDGTLVCESPHEHGKAEGKGTRYHESGEVSQTFELVAGELHGERHWYPTDTETSETATQGFGANVARVVAVYEHGQQVSVRYYDADGNEVDHWGNPKE